MYYCGIDIAKREHKACVLDATGKEVFHQRFKNRHLDANGFVRQLEQKLGTKAEEVAVVMEATGHYWLNLYGFLTKRGFSIRVLNSSSRMPLVTSTCVKRRPMPGMPLSWPTSCAWTGLPALGNQPMVCSACRP